MHQKDSAEKDVLDIRECAPFTPFQPTQAVSSCHQANLNSEARPGHHYFLRSLQ